MEQLGKVDLVCFACLCAGRKLRDISDEKLRCYYLNIICEIPLYDSTKNDLVKVCWECEALLKKAITFREQVKDSYKILQTYCCENSSEYVLSDIARKPRLQIHSKQLVEILSNVEVDVDATIEVENVKDEETITEVSVVKKEEYFSDCPYISDGEVEIPPSEKVYVETVKDEETAVVVADVKQEEHYSDCPYKSVGDEDMKSKETNIKTRKQEGRTKEKTKVMKQTTKKGKPPLKTKDQRIRIIELSYEEMLAERVNDAKKGSYINAEYKCQTCLMGFKYEKTLNKHNIWKHNRKLGDYSCPVCSKTIANLGSFMAHYKRHLRRYECLVCKKKSHDKQTIHQHYETAHDNKKEYKCNVCEKISNSINAFRYHLKTHKATVECTESKWTRCSLSSSGSRFTCGQCKKSFKWKISLRRHLEMHRIQNGQQRTPYCEICRLSFTTTANLQNHVKTSSKHQIQMKLRNMKESSENTEEKQKDCIEEIKNNINSSLNTFPCPHCDKKFQYKRNLLRHIQSHTAKATGQFYCLPCKLQFSSIATYTQHMNVSRKHNSVNDYKFICNDCGKRFPDKSRLREHINWDHLQNYTHKCGLCHKVFKNDALLYQHRQVVHKIHKNHHLCHHCGKSFPKYSILRFHISAKHSMEQPYRCEHCNTRFSWQSSLWRHVKVVHEKQKLKRRKRKEQGD